ncbi:hypothetical protein AB0O91_00900 [Kitasatospora sp. NPDC089797]|uniref:hypothetical protein n=1 Tax=Kitasatospora sp. NPDC089797 TaxID=3155298 RepID=UPI00342A9B10
MTMPVGILCWNISNLGGSAAPKHPDYIANVVQAAEPQFIVLIEVLSDESEDRGKLLPTDPGPQECLTKRTEIQTYFPAGDWKLVPPLHTGLREAVAVFYDSNHWYFTGPNIWTGTSEKPDPKKTLAGYQRDFADAMGNRKIPDDAFHNPGLRENQCAARVAYSDSAGNVLEAVGGPKKHAPYVTTFAAVDKPGKVRKSVSIIAVHGSRGKESADYIRSLARVAEIAEDLHDGEVRLVLGDFNLNSVQLDKTDGRVKYNTEFNTLIDDPLRYTLLLKATDSVHTVGVFGGYPSRFSTSLRRGAAASLWPRSNNETTRYPGYFYTKDVNDHFSLDNSYIKSRGVSLEGANLTILNPVVGAPYTDVFPLDEEHLRLRKLVASGYQITAESEGNRPKSSAVEAKFRAAYQPFYETSDHLPILIEF